MILVPSGSSTMSPGTVLAAPSHRTQCGSHLRWFAIVDPTLQAVLSGLEPEIGPPHSTRLPSFLRSGAVSGRERDGAGDNRAKGGDPHAPEHSSRQRFLE